MNKTFPAACPIPPGTQDILPLEARELRRIEEALRNCFSGYGYGEVMTPTLEYEDVLGRSNDRSLRKTFRLFDESGGVLVLRPEMTVPLARLAATHLLQTPPPLRLAYFAQAFRPTPPQRGHTQEFSQAGIEALGLPGPSGDTEVLALLIQSLAATGLRDFKVGLSDIRLLEAHLETSSLTKIQQVRVKEALVARNWVALADILEESSLSAKQRRETLDFLSLRGPTQALDQVPCRSAKQEKALVQLKETVSCLKTLGLDEHLLLDFGMARNFDYYTGIVFEVFVPQVGFPLGGGGRYDALLAKFGRDLPAVGFALGVERLHIALVEQNRTESGSSPGEPQPFVFIGGLDTHLSLAGQLRAQGYRLFSLSGKTPAQKARSIAKGQGLQHIVSVKQGGFSVECEGQSPRVVMPDQLREALQ